MKRLALLGTAMGVVVFSVWFVVGQLYDQGASGAVPDRANRLTSGIMAELEGGGSSYKICYFDAQVSIRLGKVAKVDRADSAAADRLNEGAQIDGLPAGLEQGSDTPLPVHLSSDGKLHAGYDFCEEQTLPNAE